MPSYVRLIHNNSTFILLTHGFMGVVATQFPSISTVWGWSVVIFGCYNIMKYRNQFNEAGIFSAYLVGVEIVLRMTGAELLWEFGKYGTITFLLLGLAMENIKQHRISVYILFYILSLFPSVILLPFDSFNFWRRAISFNLSGPLSLFISFLYFRNRRMDENGIIHLFRMLLLPLITMSVILIIRTPALDDIVFGSEANFQMSGGYGPNQVASSLGLVISIIALSKILVYKLFKNDIIDYLILGICSIQAYLTLARGGVLTAILAILAAWSISLGQRSSRTLKTGKIVYVVVILLILWDVAGDFTRGAMEQRYISIFDVNESGELSGSGRMLIMATDLKIFSDNIFMGVGPGMAAEMRADYGYGTFVAAHSEFTRSMAEHGFLGFLGICSLVFLSFREFSVRNKQEKCILVCFASIAVLTMLHSAMRLAMPGYIFGLAFIKSVEV